MLLMHCDTVLGKQHVCVFKSLKGAEARYEPRRSQRAETVAVRSGGKDSTLIDWSV